MTRAIVVLTGSVASGKTTLAQGLRDRYGIEHLRTQHLLQARAEREGIGPLADRRALQHYGEELDVRTGGTWVAEDLSPVIAQFSARAVAVIDAVRVPSQIEALRVAFGRRVVHVHLEAPAQVLANRYSERKSSFAELSEYRLVQEDPTESRVPLLAADADVVIDTARNTVADVQIRCAARLGLVSRDSEPLVDLIIGGEYGSEGKGNIAFYLAPEYDVLVRVGGPNAGHVVPTLPPFTHRSLPSGTMANENALLVIGAGAVVNPAVLLEEIANCRVEADRLVVDPQAAVIDQQDIDEETFLVGTIGSTGQGVGRATARRVTDRGLYGTRKPGDRALLARDVPELRPFTHTTAQQILGDAYARGDRVLLEGTQGSGLSMYHGDYPSVTSRDTTASGCLSEAGISPRRVRRIILVCRTYPIRVGGPSGPMSQDLDWDVIAQRSGLDEAELRRHERGSVSDRQRRVAEFDWVLLRQAAEINGATDIALTFADYLDAANRDARRFDQLSKESMRFIEEVEQVAGSAVTLVSTRFDRRSVLDRRSWRGHVLDEDRRPPHLVTTAGEAHA